MLGHHIRWWVHVTDNICINLPMERKISIKDRSGRDRWVKQWMSWPCDLQLAKPIYKSYAGTVTRVRRGPSLYLTVWCNDGVERYVSLSSKRDNKGKLVYTPEYIDFGDGDGNQTL